MGPPHGHRRRSSVAPSARRLVAATLVLAAPFTAATNWAQPFGEKQQNVALTSNARFTGRYGHAIVVVPGRFEYIEAATSAGLTGSSSTLLLAMGGDDFDQVNGGGGYRNDVWSTQRLDWTVVQDRVNVDE